MPPPPREMRPTHIRPSMPSAGAMKTATRNITASLSGPGSLGQHNSHASPILVARIAEKKAELENLKELKNLSGQMAAQMQALEERLATLNGGTEAIALVLSNWHNVLGVISMASSMALPSTKAPNTEEDSDIPLPQTVVRIPVQDMKQSKAAKANGE